MEAHGVERRYTPIYGGKGFIAEKANRMVDSALAAGSWHVPMLHAVGEKGYARLEPAVLQAHLAHIAGFGDRIWVDTFHAVGSYERLRAGATVSAEVVDGGITLRVQVPEAYRDQRWRQLLTVVLPVAVAQAEAPGALAVRVLADRIVLDVKPDGRPLRVSWGETASEDSAVP
jgi:hypothetical protein